MTAIKVIFHEWFGELYFMVVDNHDKKKGKDYKILYKSKSRDAIDNFLKEKGIIL